MNPKAISYEIVGTSPKRIFVGISTGTPEGTSQRIPGVIFTCFLKWNFGKKNTSME